MNKVYRVVWNEAVNRWVVTSELGSRHKKSSKFKDKVLQVGALALGMMLGSSAYAANYSYTTEQRVDVVGGIVLKSGDSLLMGSNSKQIKLLVSPKSTNSTGFMIKDADVNLTFNQALIAHNRTNTTLFNFDFGEDVAQYAKDIYEIDASKVSFLGSDTVANDMPNADNEVGVATIFNIKTAYKQDFLLKVKEVRTAADPTRTDYSPHGYGVIFKGIGAGQESKLTVKDSFFKLERGTAIKGVDGGNIDVLDTNKILFAKYHSSSATIKDKDARYSIGIELDGDVTATSYANFAVDNKTIERITLYDIKNGATLISHSQTPTFAGHRYASFTGANIGENAHFINHGDFNLTDNKQIFANLYGEGAKVSNHGNISASDGVIFHIDESSALIENDGEIKLTDEGQWIVYKGTGGETHAVKVIGGKVIVGDSVAGFTQNGLDNFTFTGLKMTVADNGTGFNLDNKINISGQIALEGEGNQGLHLTGSETFTFNEGAESDVLLITLNQGDQVAINVDRTAGLATLERLKITGNAGTGIQVLNGDLLFKGMIEMEEGGAGLYLASTMGSEFINEGVIHSDIRLGDGDNTFISEKDGASIVGDITAGSGSNTIAIHGFKGGMAFNNDANAESHNTVTLTGGTVSDIESKNGSLDLTLKDGVVVNGSLHANGDKISELTLDNNDFRYDEVGKVTGFNEIDLKNESTLTATEELAGVEKLGIDAESRFVVKEVNGDYQFDAALWGTGTVDVDLGAEGTALHHFIFTNETAPEVLFSGTFNLQSGALTLNNAIYSANLNEALLNIEKDALLQINSGGAEQFNVTIGKLNINQGSLEFLNGDFTPLHVKEFSITAGSKIVVEDMDALTDLGTSEFNPAEEDFFSNYLHRTYLEADQFTGVGVELDFVNQAGEILPQVDIDAVRRLKTGDTVVGEAHYSELLFTTDGIEGGKGSINLGYLLSELNAYENQTIGISNHEGGSELNA
ncbi:MAG: hypothetical protein GX667_08235, partial [Xanthomonadaceae bacterium]|nr:hypothetical protein [Xanthomonadaceae bacterium]